MRACEAQTNAHRYHEGRQQEPSNPAMFAHTNARTHTHKYLCRQCSLEEGAHPPAEQAQLVPSRHGSQQSGSGRSLEGKQVLHEGRERSDEEQSIGMSRSAHREGGGVHGHKAQGTIEDRWGKKTFGRGLTEWAQHTTKSLCNNGKKGRKKNIATHTWNAEAHASSTE